MSWCLCVVCAWNVSLVFCVVVLVCNVRLLRVCVCVVCSAAWHAGKNRVRPKRFRVYCQNARTCSTCGRFACAHGDALNVHTEGFFLLSPLLFLLSHSLCHSLPFFFPSSCFSCSCSCSCSSLRVHEATTFRFFFTLLKK